jgi:hypothetical protein
MKKLVGIVFSGLIFGGCVADSANIDESDGIDPEVDVAGEAEGLEPSARQDVESRLQPELQSLVDASREGSISWDDPMLRELEDSSCAETVITYPSDATELIASPQTSDAGWCCNGFPPCTQVTTGCYCNATWLGITWGVKGSYTVSYDSACNATVTNTSCNYWTDRC